MSLSGKWKNMNIYQAEDANASCHAQSELGELDIAT